MPALGSTETDYSWHDGGDGITRRFDEDELEQYLPLFDISRSARDQLIGIYAWIADSPDRDTRAYYYWLRYTHQDPVAEASGFFERAVGVLATDGHLWDHELAIIFVDPSTATVEEAIVTGYHHYPLIVSGDDAPLSAHQTDRDTHLEIEVVDPWHHYRLNFDRNGVDLTPSVDLNSFIDVRDQWENRGIFENSSRLAVDNPWALKDGRRDSWWDESTQDARAARLWHFLGLYRADEADPEVRPP